MDFLKRASGILALAALAVLGLLTLTGCENEMRQVVTSNDPTQIVTKIVSIFGVMALIFVLFAHMGLKRALLTSAQWTGVILVFLAPLRYVGTNDLGNSIAIGLSGLFVAGLSYFLLRPMRKSLRTKKKTEDDDVNL